VVEHVSRAGPSESDARPDAPAPFLVRESWRSLAVLGGIFALSRFVFFLAGIRFDISGLQGGYTGTQWQLLDIPLLKDHLLQSVWHLHSQPPLYNLFVGTLAKVPYGIQRPVAIAGYLAMGLVLVLATYLLLVDLRVPRWAAMAVALVVVADPRFVLYENWLFYAYPTAALLTVSALCCVRYLRTNKLGWGLALFCCGAGLVLLNSTWQWVWLIGLLAIVMWTFRRRLRAVVAVAAVPSLLVVGWYAKNAVMFGTYATSSWLGMNMQSVTFKPAGPDKVADLVRRGVLSPIAEVPVFSPVNRYEPEFVRVPHTGVRALEEPTKTNGQLNYNALVYVSVSKKYLDDDLAYVEAEPGAYASHVAEAATAWFVLAGKTPFTKAETHIAPYVRVFDGVVLWQPTSPTLGAVINWEQGMGPSLDQLSYLLLLAYAVAIVGTPIAVWRRRDDPALVGTLAFIWVTLAYGFLATSLVDLGENPRFCFEIGPLPVVAALAVLVSLRRSRRGAPPAAGRQRRRLDDHLASPDAAMTQSGTL
jgi:hypothetical protein